MTPRLVTTGSHPAAGRRSRAVPAARFISLVAGAVTGSVFIGTRLSASPVTRRFSATTWVEYQQGTISTLLRSMAVLMPAAVASTTAVLLLDRDRTSPAYPLTLLALATQVATGVITQRINMPLNRDVLTWDPAAPPDRWRDSRDRWERAHTIRATLAVTGHAALAAAALTSRSSRAA